MSNKHAVQLLNKLLLGAAIFILPIVLLSIGVQAQRNGPVASDPNASFVEQIASIEKTITAERENTDKLKSLLFEARQLKQTSTVDLNANKLHISTYNNILLLENTGVGDLEKALSANRILLDAVDDRIKELRKKLETVSQLKIQAAEHYHLNEKQLAELDADTSKTSGASEVISKLHALLKILSTKQGILSSIAEILTDQLSQLEKNQTAMMELSQRFEDRIKKKRKEALFQRKGNLLVLSSWYQIRDELKRLHQQLVLLGSKSFWTEELGIVWRAGGFLVTTFFVLFACFIYLMFRFQKFCVKCAERPFFNENPVRAFAFEIYLRSLPLFGTTLFLYLYAQLREVYSAVFIVRVIVDVLWLLLITRWFSDLLEKWRQAESFPPDGRITRQFKKMIRYVQFFVIIHLVVEGLIEGAGILLLSVRIFFEILFLVWLLNFLKYYRSLTTRSDLEIQQPIPFVKSMVTAFGYVIGGGALLLDLTGFGQLSIYWLSSWGQCFVVFLWGSIFFFILREWYQTFQKPGEVRAEGDKITGNPFRLMIIWMCWLAWFGSCVVGIIIAWGGRQTVIIGVFKAVNYPFAVGNMRFSLLGFIYASLILLFTHAAVSAWKRIFQSKVLANSGLEVGLQESMTTIAVYVFWMLGILFALHAFGLNTTSLVVAFGALGIGLGFGLQTIFNNFISGIILLFERPIQVGDAIEINGIWAYVKKINVRSTVVQTWDNASLIIPNSEFVSSQVTNWSFSDMRLRRSIYVGVAYGSDVELVRETLLEVAEKTSRVLKQPKPDVLFNDFGDNALIFRLRIWTVIDQMLTVESNIRFEIDRLFKERDITIAFPQRDLHIKKVTESIPLELKPVEPSANESEPGSPDKQS